MQYMPDTRQIIKVVPLHLPETIARVKAAPASAQLTYRGGPLISAVNVFTLFWGAEWGQPEKQQTATQLNDFFSYLVTSPLIDQLGEYAVDQFPIGYGSLLGTATIADSDPAAVTADADIQQFIQQQIAAGVVPAPDMNTLIFVYLPSGVVVEQGNGRSCTDFCGYHEAINGQVFYAVMPSPDCGGCLGGLSTFDAITGTSSHEFCEAITDPVPGQGWYDDNNGEIGDICAWQFKQLGNYTVQLEWSNNAGQCI
jgi:hypothetical protein